MYQKGCPVDWLNVVGMQFSEQTRYRQGSSSGVEDFLRSAVVSASDKLIDRFIHQGVFGIALANHHL